MLKSNARNAVAGGCIGDMCMSRSSDAPLRLAAERCVLQRSAASCSERCVLQRNAASCSGALRLAAERCVLQRSAASCSGAQDK
jgi:hypothetical protein